jgi:hypothetical protein
MLLLCWLMLCTASDVVTPALYGQSLILCS